MTTASIRTNASDVTFDSVAGSGLSEATARSIREADVVILPYSHLQGHGQVFPQGVAELLAHVGTSAPNLRVEVATDEVAPAELVLHGDFFDLGQWLAKNAALPTLLGVLANFIWSRLGPDPKRRHDARVRCDIHVEVAGGSSKQIHYDGPASTFEKTVFDLVNKPH